MQDQSMQKSMRMKSLSRFGISGQGKEVNENWTLH